MNSIEKIGQRFVELVEIMAKLRSDEGCPWDRQQTHESLKRYMREEMHEFLDAIDDGDAERMCEELGDIFLQLVFHAQVARESGKFDVGDALASINKKLRHRHPHVFANESANDPEDVLGIWRRQKRNEGKTARAESLLSRVPKSLPALARAQELQRAAANVGFDWPDADGAFAKVKEEFDELEKEIGSDARSPQCEEEMGDLLFAVVNLCRFLTIEAEDALQRANRKFEARFAQLEKHASAQGRSLDSMTLEEMDELWDMIKGKEQ